MPKIASQAKRLRIYIGEGDRWERHSLFQAIVAKAKELDLAGATVSRGLMGYGADKRIHTASIVDLSSDSYLLKLLTARSIFRSCCLIWMRCLKKVW